MARIRTIKPEFFTSEDIVALSPLARLLYIALWCEADKEGRLHWKPRTFKMRYLPGDDCDIHALCAELAGAAVVVLYGDGHAYIPSFSKHQHINPRESASDIPAPQGVSDAGPKKVGKLLREAVMERDGHRCVRCASAEQLAIDHILPQSAGGPHILENLRVLCRRCNSARPVAGKALEEDLLMDGLTLEILRRKFGIDASIPELHTQGGREGKGREGKGREGEERVSAADSAADPCPHQAIIALYHETLPQLAQVRTWDADRQALLRSRWRESTERQSIDWWRDFFEYVGRCPFLLGQGSSGDRDPFLADLEWLIRPKNFRKVIEGKYEPRAAA